jgi:hypothetical protein
MLDCDTPADHWRYAAQHVDDTDADPRADVPGGGIMRPIDRRSKDRFGHVVRVDESLTCVPPPNRLTEAPSRAARRPTRTMPRGASVCHRPTGLDTRKIA